MTRRNLRFTGEWPPLELWEQYPNWEHALDEESTPGQDETTLRPAAEARIVGRDVAFTAGDVVQADGTQLPALIDVIDGKPVGVTAFVTADAAWSVQELGSAPRWECIVEDWLPEDERQPSVSFGDATVFPLEVHFRLPHRLGEKPQRFRIEPTGVKVELTG